MDKFAERISHLLEANRSGTVSLTVTVSQSPGGDLTESVNLVVEVADEPVVTVSGDGIDEALQEASLGILYNMNAHCV